MGKSISDVIFFYRISQQMSPGTGTLRVRSTKLIRFIEDYIGILSTAHLPWLRTKIAAY